VRQPIAVGIDIRTRGFAVVNVLGGGWPSWSPIGGPECRLLFIDCDDEALARRYTETRRRPSAGPAIDRSWTAIRLERELVSPLARPAPISSSITSVSKPARSETHPGRAFRP